MSDKLFAEFPPVSNEEWRAAVERDLKGADFDRKLVKKTLDGIALRPYYRRDDLPTECEPLATPRGIRLREEIREPDLDEANAHLHRAIRRDVHEFAISIYPSGPLPDTVDDLDRLLYGIDLTKVSLHWNCGPLARPLIGHIAKLIERRGLNPDSVRGSLDLDPIMDRAARWLDEPTAAWSPDTVELLQLLRRDLPGYGWFGIRASFVEKAGASLAQELALSLALLSEYLGACADAGMSADEVLARTEIRFGVGTNYVLEIAKLRAARILLDNLVTSFGGRTIPNIHTITTSSNKTLYDAHNNLLRATIEGMAAVIGGADSLSPAAYDQGYHTPDEFSEHLARNTAALLEQEANLTLVADPLAGSYTIEALTTQYAESAWETFRRIEDRGGFVEALPWIADELGRVKQARSTQVNMRRRTIVGTTVYANSLETRLPDILPPRMARQVVKTGYTEKLSDWLGTTPVPSTAFDPFRPSWPFEHLRLRVEQHIASSGKRPIFQLLLAGDVKMRNARAAFCTSFFSAAGYEIRQTVATEIQAAQTEAVQRGADAIVLCSSDDEVLALARAAVPDSSAVLVVAGYPEQHLDDLRAAGVEEFVHARQNHLDTLIHWHGRLGIPELPMAPTREEALA